MHSFCKHPDAKDLRRNGRIILAEGETTGHLHEVTTVDGAVEISTAEFFEEPDGRRVLLVNRPCLLRHEEHDPIALDPARLEQVRQGDVLLQSIAPGAWEVIRQKEYFPKAIRQVQD